MKSTKTKIFSSGLSKKKRKKEDKIVRLNHSGITKIKPINLKY